MERDFSKSHAHGLGAERSLIGRFCSRPFDHVEVHVKGEVYACCPAWIKAPIGNFNENSLSEIWASPKAQELRNTILDGSYSQCMKDWCPDIQGNRLPRNSEVDSKWQPLIQGRAQVLYKIPTSILLSYDESCNLSCPSCRTTQVHFSRGTPQYFQAMKYTDRILTELYENPEVPVELHLSGSGDPFASPVFLNLLESIDSDRLPNLTLRLKTNGILLNEKTFTRIQKAQKCIRAIMISIDAAQADTYAVVRRGGEWNRLLKNIEFMRSQRTASSFELIASFVVQQKNYRETAEFARFFINLDFNEIQYLLVDNFGSWENDQDFQAQCIWKKNHPEFSEFLKILEDPILEDRRVKLGGLTEYRNIALKK